MLAVLSDQLLSYGVPPWLAGLAASMAFIAVVYAAFVVVERFRPVEKTDWSSLWLNVRLAAVLLPVIIALSIWLQPVLGQAVRGWFADGPGVIKTGTYSVFWQQALLYVLYLLSYDFLYYWLHRAQHRWDSLWAIHKLHHSEPHVNVTTTLRVHWLEEVMKAVIIIFPISLLFDAVPSAGWVAAILGIWLFFVHANLRISFGPMSWLLTSPAAHRLHHSLDHGEANSNFAVIFPVWDVLFGTYRRPTAGVWPKTGVAGETPPTFARAVIEPLVRLPRRASAVAKTQSIAGIH